MDLLFNAFSKSQEAIDGKVTVEIYKGNVFPASRESRTSLYNRSQSSMDEQGDFDSIDSRGFININAVRLKAHSLSLRRMYPFEWRKRLIQHQK
jgi:argininosuccinate synthase